jgi:rare lipoprotein A (peptidoglycan hydrolase)
VNDLDVITQAGVYSGGDYLLAPNTPEHEQAWERAKLRTDAALATRKKLRDKSGFVRRWLGGVFMVAIVSIVCATIWAARADGRPVGGQALASWYGPGLYGNVLGCAGHPKVPTRFRVGHFGVAHKTLPCGTMVLVCYRRCAWARVIDRGPFIAGRDFDLTAAVARYVRFSTGPWHGRPDGVHRIKWSLR